MKKNFKYILIFIFIVCLLIPISCINIFATSFTYYNVTNSNRLKTYIYYVDSIDVKYKKNGETTYHNGYTNNNLSIYDYIQINSYYDSNYNIYCSIFGWKNNNYTTLTNNLAMISDFRLWQIFINCNDNSYVYATRENTTKLFNYNIKSLDKYNDYYNLKYTICKDNTLNTNADINYYFTIPATSISFDKTYNLTFYNNDILYDSITISGASASGYAPFEEISQIKYGDTIVWNRIWANGYDNVLRYNQLMSEPNITTINTDCANIISFTTQSFTATESITNRYQLGTFYNDSSGDVPYSDIYITGTVAIGTSSPFITISEIKFNNTSVYLNGSFYSGYSSTLYSYSNNPLNLTTINSDANNIVTFTNISLGTYIPLNDILSGVAGIFGVTTTLIASAQTNWILAIFMAMSVFMLLVLVIFKFIRGNSSGGSK